MTRHEIAMVRIKQLVPTLQECDGMIQRIILIKMIEMYARYDEEIIIPDSQLEYISHNSAMQAMDEVLCTIDEPKHFSYDVLVCWDRFSLVIHSIDVDYLRAE